MADFSRAQTLLEAVQSTDLTKLPRTEELGSLLNFADAVPPAKLIVDLYKLIPVQELPNLPQDTLNKIAENGEKFNKAVLDILAFKPTQADAAVVHSTLVGQFGSIYERAFNQLSPLIGYIANKKSDFIAIERTTRERLAILENEALNRLDASRKIIDDAMASVETKKLEAERLIDSIREVAAEKGVSQQADHFKSESESHSSRALQWKWTTIVAAVLLLLAAAGVAVVPKNWLGLGEADTYQIVQIALSKVLIFGVLGYLLILSSRNFLSHVHNAIVNKHRQNALLTYNSLVQAAGGTEAKDIVLTQAAAAIFSPQETGYTKQSSGDQSASIISAAGNIARLARPGS